MNWSVPDGWTVRRASIRAAQGMQLAHARWIGPGERYAGQLLQEAIGIPVHDVRTLAADHLRRSRPGEAARLIGTLLGHRDPRSGEAYRVDAEGRQAAMDWAAIRSEIAKGTRKAARGETRGLTA